MSTIIKNPRKFLGTRENMKSFSNRFFGINDRESIIAEIILRSINTK